MTKQKAQSIVETYLYTHIDANNFWTDESYREEIEALAKLGDERAQQALEMLDQK